MADNKANGRKVVIRFSSKAHLDEYLRFFKSTNGDATIGMPSSYDLQSDFEAEEIFIPRVRRSFFGCSASLPAAEKRTAYLLT